LIFILASSQVCAWIAQYPADPRGSAGFFGYDLIIVDRAAAARSATATGRDGAAAATTTTVGKAGADVGFDLHFGFLSCFALDCAVSGRPGGRPNSFAYGLGVNRASAATGVAAAASAAAATVDGAAATVAKAGANVGLDLHFGFLPRFAHDALYSAALMAVESRWPDRPG
jgi:hypothetical protein